MHLVLISRAMLSNSLIQFSVFGWSCVPSLLFTWGRTIVEVMKIMLKVKWSAVAQSCPTLSDLMDCSLPGSSVHGIFQARVLEWGAIACFDNGILLSHKKECIWVSSNEVEEPRAYYTQWSKSEREILILYTDAYIWESKKMVLMNLFSGKQCRNRSMDVGEGRRVKVSCMERGAWKFRGSYIKWQPVGICYDSGNSNKGFVTDWMMGWWGRWEGSSGGTGMAVFLLMCVIKPQNSVKQLSFNLKFFKK